MAAVELFSDQPTTTVSSGGTTAPAAGTSESWTVASSASFPAASSGASPPSQFHVVDAATAKQSEIIAVTNVSGTTWTVTRGAEGTTPVAHTAGFTVFQVATSGYLNTVTGQYFGYPWQFYPENFGATGNGIVCTVNTTATSTTITATSSVFTSTAVDGGKYIMIHGANGTTSAPLITTISTVTNATTAVLAAAPSSTVSACPAVFGTDDTTAIKNAVTAAGNYATAHSYYAEVIFAAKIYILGTGPTQTGNGTSTPTFNSQIPLPYPNANGTTQKLVIALTGAGADGHLQFWQSTTPNLAGTCLVSMVTAPAPPDTTFGVQSVIGGPSQQAGFTTVAAACANVQAVITNLAVWCYCYTNETAIDLRYVSGCHVDGVACHIFAPTGVNNGVQPYLKDLPGQVAFQNTYGYGFRAPAVGNNADVTVPSLAVEGYVTGVVAGDFFTGGRIVPIYVYTALLVDLTSGLSSTGHLISVANFEPEAYQVGISSNGGSGGYGFLNISMDAECTGVVADVSDASSTLHGIVYWSDPSDSRALTVSGAANLKIIDCKTNGPGHMASPPSVPASASAAALVWRDATVVVHTGGGVTVSAITVDGTATSQTVGASASSVPVRVPSGKTIALTYAGGTPTWDWWLD